MWAKHQIPISDIFINQTLIENFELNGKIKIFEGNQKYIEQPILGSPPKNLLLIFVCL